MAKIDLNLRQDGYVKASYLQEVLNDVLNGIEATMTEQQNEIEALRQEIASLRNLFSIPHDNSN